MNRKTLISVTALTAALSAASSSLAQAGDRLAIDEVVSILLPAPDANDVDGNVPTAKPIPIDVPGPRPSPVPPIGEDGFCKADTNKDKLVTYPDLFAFLEMYFSGKKEADMNADRVLNSADIFDYIAHFVTGC